MVCRIVLLAAICCIMPEPVTIMIMGKESQSMSRKLKATREPPKMAADKAIATPSPRTDLRDGQHARGAHEGSYTEGRHQKSQRVRSSSQNVRRRKWASRRGVGHGHKAGKRQQQQDRANRYKSGSRSASLR